jgi:hypothetical protein
MTERGLLMKGFLVRKTLAGLKWQTRRLLRTESRRKDGAKLAPELVRDLVKSGLYGGCPYGQPGDRLWVREAFGINDALGFADHRRASVTYRADWDAGDLGRPCGPWKPGIHMPRWASRLMLPIKSIRVERTQDISADDIQAEGFVCPEHEALCVLGMEGKCKAQRDGFATGWDRINGKREGGSWAENPWVWVIEWEPVRQ